MTRNVADFEPARSWRLSGRARRIAAGRPCADSLIGFQRPWFWRPHGCAPGPANLTMPDRKPDRQPIRMHHSAATGKAPPTSKYARIGTLTERPGEPRLLHRL